MSEVFDSHFSSSMQQKIELSVIIPSLNEARNIAKVVSQFHALDGVCAYEVIIGDGGSTDATCEIAESLGARVVHDTHEPKTVASGRNAGAAIARGSIYMFCDADTALSDVKGILRASRQIFQDPNVVAAIPRMEVFPEEKLLKDELFHSVFNSLIRMSFLVNMPLSRGQCQIIRADAFRKVGGYNSDQVHADDNTIFQDLSKIGKLRFLNDFIVYESPRRYRKYGYMKLSMIGVGSILAQSILKRNVLEKWERVD